MHVSRLIVNILSLIDCCYSLFILKTSFRGVKTRLSVIDVITTPPPAVFRGLEHVFSLLYITFSNLKIIFFDQLLRRTNPLRTRNYHESVYTVIC